VTNRVSYGTALGAGVTRFGREASHCHVNSKVNIVLNYPTHHEDVWNSRGIAAPFLTSALGVFEWSASLPGRFTPVEMLPLTQNTNAFLLYD
jgi:hypothetical protein